MNTVKIPAIVIEIPEICRSAPLIEILSKSSVFEIIKLPAVMFQFSKNEYHVDLEHLKVVYGRKMNEGEIGCAISHMHAQEILSKTNFGGIVLEDDARIPDLIKFEDLILRFFGNMKSDEKSLLSLLPWRHRNSVMKTTLGYKSAIYKLTGTTPLTVAYAVNAKAAKELSFANKAIKYLPDWPKNDCTFYTSIDGVVNHGDSKTFSLIGDRQFKKKFKLKLAIATSIYFFQNKNHFNEYRNYFGIYFKPFFTWRIDNLKFNTILLLNRFRIPKI